MLAQGFSTFPETLEPNVRSDCHAWSSSPCYDFLSTICGIDTDGPGFNKVLIEPNPGTLTDVTGAIPHPKGQIKVHYKKISGNRYTAKIYLPPTLTGRFISKGKIVNLKSGKQAFTFKR